MTLIVVPSLCWLLLTIHYGTSFVLLPLKISKENPQQYTDRIGWTIVNRWPPPVLPTSHPFDPDRNIILSSSRRKVDSSSSSTSSSSSSGGSRGSSKRVSNKNKETVATTTAALPLNYRRNDDNSEYVVEMTSVIESAFNGKYTTTSTSFSESLAELENNNNHIMNDPRLIEFVTIGETSIVGENKAKENTLLLEQQQQQQLQDSNNMYNSNGFFPFATMMSGCAPYIAGHAGKVAVFHIPGSVIVDDNDTKIADNLLSDMALCWLMGMKIVIVAGSLTEGNGNGNDNDNCSIPSDDSSNNTTTTLYHQHECDNTLRVTNSIMIRHIEEEASFIRTEIERKLNRCLRAHGACSTTKSMDEEGNVVSGNFYTAQQFGTVRDINYQYTGYTSSVHTDSISKVLQNNDVVLLSTVGLSPYGDLVNVNGYHLAATVAAQLYASKLIFIANTDSSVLRRIGETTSIQEIPLSFSKSIVKYYDVKCHNTGYATFVQAQKTLRSGDVEFLLNLGWCNWSLDRGVGRAHIVNPITDGALLEELFTSNNGANTCLYHDDDMKQNDYNIVATEDWDEFFKSST
jgi:amino-acid N-acetyltransferase